MSHVRRHWAVAGGLAGLLLASCAAVTGLGDYEIAPDSADSGGSTTSGDADFRADQAVDGPFTSSSSSSSSSSASSSTSSSAGGDPNLPTVDCSPTCGTEKFCSLETCENNLTWDVNGPSMLVARTGGRCVPANFPTYLSQEVKPQPVPNKAAATLSFTLIVNDTTDGTVAELTSDGERIFYLVVSKDDKLLFCMRTGTSTVGCFTASTNVARGKAMEIDLYAAFDGSHWKGAMSVDKNACPGDISSSVAFTTKAPSKLEGRVGCVDPGATPACKIAVDNLRLVVHPN